jgi:hypothetical protein
VKGLSIEFARDYLKRLDLNYIAELMCSEQYPLPRWTYEDAQRCCQLYKNFLFLIKKHLPLSLVPTREIDEFWHNHILYTRNYLRDCEQLFGHYLHHEPATTGENPAQLIKNFVLTKQLYWEEFKEPLVLEKNQNI